MKIDAVPFPVQAGYRQECTSVNCFSITPRFSDDLLLLLLLRLLLVCNRKWPLEMTWVMHGSIYFVYYFLPLQFR